MFKTHCITAALIAIFLVLPARGEDAVEEIELQLSEAETGMFENLPDIPLHQQRKPGETAFAVISFNQPKEDLFYLRDGKPEKVYFNNGTIRRFQYGVFSKGIIFYRMAEVSEGEKKPIPVARAVTDQAKDGIIVFAAKSKSEDDGVDKMPFIDISKDSFSTGQVRLLNLTALSLLANLSDTPVSLNPMSSVVRTPPRGSSIFSVQLAFQDDGKTKMIYSNVFQSESEMRILYLIIPDHMNANASSPIRCMVYKDAGSVSQ